LYTEKSERVRDEINRHNVIHRVNSDPTQSRHRRTQRAPKNNPLGKLWFTKTAVNSS